MLITFSGLDGAGKTTLIDILSRVFESRKRSVARLTMYDHVGVYPFLRAARERLRGGGRSHGNGASKPSPWLAALRSPVLKRPVLFLDLLILLALRAYQEALRRRILILDRYFYDSLVDVADGEHWGFIRFCMRLIPAPDLPVYVDVSPEVAFRRKGEYSVEHLRHRQACYRRIFDWIDRPLLLQNADLAASSERLTRAAEERAKLR